MLSCALGKPPDSKTFYCTSDMRIFIIGSEGSGKTVFLAMLSRYVANLRGDLVIEPIDYATSQYVATAQAALERGDWPRGNPPGKLQLLKWRVGRRGKTLHEMEMFDSAGQDLREILLGVDQTKLTAEQQAIQTCIDESDILFYLLDLEVFIGSKDLCALNEDTWLFTTFLTRPAGQDKKRTVVLSKADIYSAMLAQSNGNFKDFIKSRLPTVYSVEHLLDIAKTVDYLAVTSVETATAIAADGSPRRVPQNPLQAGDLGPFLQKLLTSLGEPEPAKATKANESGSGLSDAEAGAMLLGAIIGGAIGAAIGLMIGGYVGGILGLLVIGYVGLIIGAIVRDVIERSNTRTIGTAIGEVIDETSTQFLDCWRGVDTPADKPIAKLADRPLEKAPQRGKRPPSSGNRRTKKRPGPTNQ